MTKNLKGSITYAFDDHKVADLKASKTLYAVWWYEIDVNFNVNSEDGFGGPAEQHIYRSTDIVPIKAYGEDENDPLPTPTRPGYTFLGWSRDANATVPELSMREGYPRILNVQAPDTGRLNVTLYAVWEKNE